MTDLDPRLFGELFSPEWRAEHARRGDELLNQARISIDTENYKVEGLMAVALLAQAHYAAANVRAKPVPVAAAGESGGPR